MNKESRELSPAQREVASHLLAVARRGSISARDERHAALHGTSLEMVMRLIENGKLVERSGGSHGLVDFSHGDIAVFPTAGMMIPTLSEGSEWAKDFLFSPEEAEESVQDDANIDAQTHYLLRRIGLSIDNRENIDNAYRLMSNAVSDLLYCRGAETNLPKEEVDAISYFIARGVSIDELHSTVEEGVYRKGFLLGISSRILDAPGVSISGSELGDPQMLIKTSGGLPYKFILGLEPLGPVEEKFLEDLRDRINL